MVEHAHREHGVEGLQRRQLLDAQRQEMRPLVVAEQLTHRFKLAQEQLGGIDADRQMRAGADHSPHVIAAAAAHVEDSPPGKIGQVRQDALPFPVGTPFGIDINAVQRIRPFAPRHQVFKQVFYPQLMTFAERRFALGGDAVQEIQTPRR